jgi:uncharacterized cysteine cluster protein YcgN (CxxCxxCC family)
MRRDDWEALCQRCGLCCYEKRYTRGGMVVDLRLPCRYLDEKSRQCSVYERRFVACPECRRMTVFHALFCGYLPASCGYVRRFRKWRRSSNPLLRS